MLKVLVVSERLWPNGGGGELATNVILDLLRKKFSIRVVTGTKNPEKVSGVDYLYEPLLSRREKVFLWFNILRLLKRPYFCKLLEWSDIVYVPRFSFPVIPPARKLGKRTIVHLHDYIPISYTATVLAPYEEHKDKLAKDDLMIERMKGIGHYAGVSCLWWLPKLARNWIEEADTIMCVSHRQAEIISDFAPELARKIKVVYNPPPLNLLNTNLNKNLDNTPTFLYLGGGSYIKGFHIFIKASIKLLKRGVKAKFILTNEYKPQHLALIQRLNNVYGNAYALFRRIDYANLLKLHEKAWGLIFPSIWEEPLPYAVFEACILKTIPIASSVGGVHELIDRIIARQFIFEPRNPEALAEKIEVLSSMDSSEVCDLGYIASKSVNKKFNNEDIAQKIAEVFEF